MKRGAENQLTKDLDLDGDEGDNTDPGRGIVKANEQVLARREIRGLPRRSMAAATPSAPSETTNTDAPAVPKFAGFAGFGTSSTSSTPFSFTPSASGTTNAKPATTTAPSFGFPSSAPSGPAVATGASNATKAFASFIGSSSSQPSKLSESKSQDKMDEDDDEELKKTTEFFKALRGLNNSFISAISEAVKSDTFADLTPYLDLYKSMREKEKKSYNETMNTVKTGSSSSASSGSTTAPGKSAMAMPTPPASFSGFSGFPSTTTSSTSSNSSSGGGFGFKPTVVPSSTSAPFSFPPASSTALSDPSAPSKSPFSLGGPRTITKSSSSPFSFGNTSSSASSNPFGSSSTSSPSVFGSNLFGAKPEADKSSSSNTTANPFGSGSSAFTKPPTSPSSRTPSFLFGGNNTTPSSTDDKPSSDAGGNANPAAAPLFAGFGKTPGSGSSLGNPVGFGFGSPPPPAPLIANPFGRSSVIADPFAPSAISTKVKQEPSEAAGSLGGSSVGSSAVGSEEGTPAPADPASLLKQAASAHDLDGEGEEDESSEHQVRSKVFKLTKKDDNSQGWADMGVGILKVKKHKTSGARRLLLRNSGTGKIIINFNIYTGMTPSVAKNTVSFVGHDNTDAATVAGSPTTYRLRVKTEGEAHQLKDALDRAIEFVQSKSD